MSNSHEILGNWVYRILLDHFNNQRNEGTSKLFIKISGLTEKNVLSLLEELNQKQMELDTFYTPIIRTIKGVDGYDHFKLKEHETSTWLRNYTSTNHALIIVINELTPEAQSLENLFSIDEGYLLSSTGLNSLYSLLSERYNMAVEEIDTLRDFFSMYSKLTEPQLRFILRFLEKALNQNTPSIIEKIQTNLPELNLFKDKELIIGTKGIKRLRDNYYLSNLQKPNGNLDTEKLLNNLYLFVETHEQNNFADELWNGISGQNFEKVMVEFINQKNYGAYEYEFSTVEAALNFKTKSTLTEKIRMALIDNNPNISKQEKNTIEEGINEIDRNSNPDAIQEFLEEFEEELSQHKLDKVISRRVEKLLHPKDYYDIIDALQYEIFALIDDNLELIDKSSRFKLTVSNRKLTEQMRNTVLVYLSKISNITPSIEFDMNSVDNITLDESANESLSFNLLLINNDNTILATEKFKVTGFEELQFQLFKDSIFENKIPYLKNFQEDEVELVDVKNEIQLRVQGYLSINEPGVQEHFDIFSSFLDNYVDILKQFFNEGVFSIDIHRLKTELDDVLSGVTTSVDVANHIYRYINYIGAIDSLDVKAGQSGFSHERILTLLNPIRLISYISRFEVLDNQIQEWFQRSQDEELEVTNLDDYLEHVNEKTLNLAPRYFSSDGDDAFLIEINEVLGEGQFILNTKRSDNMDYLSNELSEELVKSVKSYFEVYPYAKDGLDILFLYCQSADIITKSIDSLFRKFKDLNKLKITVHSTQAAIMHQVINQWIKKREEFTNPEGFSKFPVVEVNVISGNKINDISNQIEAHMIDADLVILADYFGQSNQVKYEFDKIDYKKTDKWLNLIFKEPLLETEQLKRISYVSEYMPNVLKSFYQLQYIFQKKEMLEEDEIFVLKNKISLSNFSDNELIDYMHDNFNWIMFMDRYLDKSLLEKASSKAQIIQYKSKAGANKNYKVIVSSSEYIKKLNSNAQDYEYYDRLTKKLSLVLKSDNIDKDKVKEAVRYVKSISGALVLKAIGPGKYSHEMVATYLSKKHRSKESSSFQVWATCDELPWFGKNKRRPDLVITTLHEDNGEISLNFELLELKFVSQSIFERERYDAIKQIESGKKLYENLFDFTKNKADAEYWRNELVHYFIEKETYSPEQAHLLRKLQSAEVSTIKVDIDTSIDAYCYTSNLYENSYEMVQENVYKDLLDGEHTNFIYNRTFILSELGATYITEPDYEELSEPDQSFSESLVMKNHKEEIDEEEEASKPPSVDQNEDTGYEEKKLPEDNDDETGNNGPPLEQELNVFPEELALKGVQNPKENSEKDHTELKRKYVSVIETNYNQLNYNVKVKEIIVGSSVIRFNLSFPKSIPPEKIMKTKSRIQIWLQLDQEPNMFIDRHGLNIDIVREEPETVYFEEFMKIAREQLSGIVKKTNLVAPLGIDPLNNVTYIDLSDPTTPHLLTGGTTGSGKSVTLNAIILGTMCFYDPSKLQFVFIDPKQVEFSIYEDLPHTHSVVTGIDEAVLTLNNLVEEMEKRYGLFKKEFASNLDEYIEATGINMPRIVVVFDEFADFMSQEKEIANQVENAILRLGQKARAAGIHLIICTQNPKSDIINTNIRNNLGARLALRATDSIASSVILGEGGAENLGGKGDFLAKTSSQKVTRGKSPFLTPVVKRALLKYFMSN
ncbi:FtsK/SpoIIIE domain-containing protein [Jeotgalibacillus sp. ET6]|uniref:FtsK/SpoIIIE domain-containing protein n=1 Tax=Jeotgalibacillus sp. ET6 TaxID=3037260 RepID=UPI0024184890|nr:FtsK/SpoIIIE domain-containing protein [Jeotgalibacillus sp. ET6]MDG5472075.1 FtsK/SpoIIIE domain-containing protein [Jeotgalibacillus sp. ET6]